MSVNLQEAAAWRPGRWTVEDRLTARGRPHFLLPPERVLFAAHATAVDELFEIAAGSVAPPGTHLHVEIIKRLSCRQAHSTTGLGMGVSLPHAAIRGLRTPTAVFIRSRHGINFGADDSVPVFDTLILLVPRPANGLHHDLLGRLSALITDSLFRSALAKRSTESGIWQLFANSI